MARNDSDQVSGDHFLSGHLSRRDLLKRFAVLGVGASALSGLLTACADEDADDDVAAEIDDEDPDDDSDDAAPDDEADDAVESDVDTDPDVFNFGALQEPDHLDPHRTTSVVDVMMMNVYDGLTDVDAETGEVIPELATSWDISDDGLVVTFDLREGVVFSDGADFDADAAIVNFDRCIALESYIPEAFSVIESYQAIDDLTLEVTLQHILSPWVGMLCRNPKMVSPLALEENDNGDLAQDFFAETTVGTGAYNHVRWDRGSLLVWEAFEDHWRGWDGDHVSTVNIHIIEEAGTQRLQVEAGELDVAMHYSLDSIPIMQENPDLNVLAVDLPNHLYIRLNNFDGPTSDVRVRQAISYAFDFDEYTTLLGVDPPPIRAGMPVPTDLFGEGFDPVEIPYYTYDPERALSLLEEAGYGDGFEMNHYHDPGVPQKDLLGEYFQAAMSQIGISVEIVIEPFTNILARATDQDLQMNWDTAIHSWNLFTSPVYPDPSSFLLRMYTPYPESVRNLLGYSNEEVERLTHEALQETDMDRALELYWEANLLIVEDCPDLVLDRSIEFEILRNWVQGHTPHAIDPWRWTYWNVWKEV